MITGTDDHDRPDRVITLERNSHRKRAICEKRGLVGVFPTDEVDARDPALSLSRPGVAISRAMERVMRACDAMIVIAKGKDRPAKRAHKARFTGGSDIGTGPAERREIGKLPSGCSSRGQDW